MTTEQMAVRQIPFFKPSIREREIELAVEAMRNGWLTMGQRTFEFEKAFAAVCGCDDAVAVNSCTAALHLALVLAGVGPGDEVIIPAMTFVATAETVTYTGAVPVLADVDIERHLIDVRSVAGKINNRTKAVIAVDYAGQPADYDELRQLCDTHKLVLIADAAHSFPANYKGRPVGTLADFTCFSFYATKTITTGEGGMLTARDNSMLQKARVLRLHGISRDAWKRYSAEGSWEYDALEVGYKYNLTDVASGLGLGQLERADEMRECRRHICERYDNAFAEYSQLELHHLDDDRTSSYHIYPLKLKTDRIAIDRNTLFKELKAVGVHCSVHFIPLHHFSGYQQYFKNVTMPVSDNVFSREITLPLYPDQTDDEADYVIARVCEMCRRYAR